MRFVLELEVFADIDEGSLTDDDKVDALHKLLEAGSDNFCASYKLHAVEVVEEG